MSRPLWQKSFEARPFHDLWVATRRLLATRKALVFIGYSLPTTDVYTQAMLRIDVPELDFLLIVNPDPHARARIRRVLRSALRPYTRLVELQSLAEVGSLLETSSAEAPRLDEVQFQRLARDAIKKSHSATELTLAPVPGGGPDLLLQVGEKRVVVEIRRAFGVNFTRRLREARDQVERWIDQLDADAGLVIVPDAAPTSPTVLSERVWRTTPRGLAKALTELAQT